jgi:GR25 family glycosyltransferase involved in LPS biosynthesis
MNLIVLKINIKKDNKSLSDYKIKFNKIKIEVIHNYNKKKLKFIEFCCYASHNYFLYKLFIS